MILADVDTTSTNSTAKMLLTMLAAVAEFERDLMKERKAEAHRAHAGRSGSVVERQRYQAHRRLGKRLSSVCRCIEKEARKVTG